MEYFKLRKEILHYLVILQKKGFSYQSICDFINQKQLEFVLFKDFFSRFQSKPSYYKSASKQKKLTLIHQHLQIFFHQNIDSADAVENLLGNIISDVAEAKFAVYLGINRSVEDFEHILKDFYIENSPAYLHIVNNIKHKKQYGWELDIINHGSTFKVLSVHTNELFEQNAILKTKEFWKLSWVDKNTRKLQYKSESLGLQTHLLSKDFNGKWKIAESMVVSQSNRVIPPYIDYPVLEQLLSDHPEENKSTALKLLFNEELLQCIAFIKMSFADQLPQAQNAILNRIKISCLNSHRLLNTNAINFASFHSEIESLNKQIHLVCESIFLRNK